jgi:hypothetical protein
MPSGRVRRTGRPGVGLDVMHDTLHAAFMTLHGFFTTLLGGTTFAITSEERRKLAGKTALITGANRGLGARAAQCSSSCCGVVVQYNAALRQGHRHATCHQWSECYHGLPVRDTGVCRVVRRSLSCEGVICRLQ